MFLSKCIGTVPLKTISLFLLCRKIHQDKGCWGRHESDCLCFFVLLRTISGCSWETVSWMPKSGGMLVIWTQVTHLQMRTMYSERFNELAKITQLLGQKWGKNLATTLIPYRHDLGVDLDDSTFDTEALWHKAGGQDVQSEGVPDYSTAWLVRPLYVHSSARDHWVPERLKKTL